MGWERRVWPSLCWGRHRANLIGIKELWKKREKSEDVWEGAEMLVLGRLVSWALPALPFGCPPAPAARCWGLGPWWG